jgi:hypothetical protein
MDAHGRLCCSTSPARRVPKLLRDKEVPAAVAAIASSCLTIWPGSTCRVNTLSIRRGQHQPQPVFSDLCDPEIESYLAALAAFDARYVVEPPVSFLVISAGVRRDSSDRPRAVHGGTSASSGSGGDPPCPSPTADLLDGSRHFVDHWSSGMSCVRSTSAGVSSAKQCG